MANSLTAFSKLLWSKSVSRLLQKRTVFRNIGSFAEQDNLSAGISVDRPYRVELVAENYAKLTGATAQDISGVSEKLTIDKFKDVFFKIDKIDKKQNAYDMQAVYADASAKTLGIAQDAEFLYEALSAASTVDDGDLGGTSGNGITLTTANVDTVFSVAGRKLDLQNVDVDNRAAAISPHFYQVIWERIAGRQSVLGDKVLEYMAKGTYANFDLFMTNNLTASARWTPANNPSDGDTITIQGVTFTFKSTIGTTAGNVLIKGTTALTLTNLVAFINAGGATTDSGVSNVSLSTANQRAVQMWVAVDGTTYFDVRVKGGNYLTVTGSDAADVWSRKKQHNYFCRKGATDMVVQREIDAETQEMTNQGISGVSVLLITYFGIKTYNVGTKELVNVELSTSAF